MWRNIFGHAIIQIIILNIIIFVGPTGWLVQPYGILCALKNLEDGNCVLWNPYYANSLYQTPDTIAAW